MKHLQKFGYIAIGSMLTLAVMGTALAATGALTIEVNPINVQVNGQTFQPKDAAGQTVPVFAYNGTTYAPLRALAEAYGLKVGYDAEKNMATIGETTPTKTPANKPATDYSTWTAEEEKAYQEFKGMWEVGHIAENKSYLGLRCYTVTPEGSVSEASRIGEATVNAFLTSNTPELIEKCCLRLSLELHEYYDISEIRYAFEVYGTWGWADRVMSGEWKCGYKDYLERTTVPW